jgi:hypothetical protein
MKKLGIAGVQQLDSAEFKQYLMVFKEGLTTEQTRMIHELFMEHDPQHSVVEGMLE